MGGALGRSMTYSHEKVTIFNDASWKVYFSPKVGVLAHCTELKTVKIFKIGC
jgi:hypothetical protein